MTTIHAVFFDMDGTLFDTVHDLASALNQVLIQHSRSPVSVEKVREVVSLGTPGIIQCGFSIDKNHPDYKSISHEFLQFYSQHLTDTTTFFEGMPEVLSYLDEHTIPWGVVTNKPFWLAEPLLRYFELTLRCRCLIAGDTLAKRKPDPEPLLHACQRVSVNPQSAAYVGDTQTDMQAAKAAGMTAIAARYGYLLSPPETWNADWVIDEPRDLIQYL